MGETEPDYYDYTNDIITNDVKYNEHLEIISKLITFYVLNGCKINTDKTGYLLYEVKLKKYKDLEKEPGGEKKVQTMIIQNFQNLVRYNKLLNDIYTLTDKDTDNLEYDQSKLEIIKQAKLKLTDFESQLKEKIKNFFRENDYKLKEYKITIATISPIIKSLKNFEYLAKDEEGKYYKKSIIMNGLIYLLKHVEADLKQKGGKKSKVVSKKKKVISKKKKVASKKKKVVSKKKKVVSKKKKVVSKKRKVVSKKKKVVSKKKVISKKKKTVSK